VKLYTYTKKRSLPRLAMKGLPKGAALGHSSNFESALDGMYGDYEGPKDTDPNVMLEVDVTGLEPDLVVDAQWAFQLISDGYAEEEDFDEWTDLDKTAELLGYMLTDAVIPPGRITVLGELRPDFGPASLDAPWDGSTEEILAFCFLGKPKPLKSFRQPLVSRLLRSIFLPQHKLYGSGKKVTMGVRLVRVNA
jgi:hypothetical protein